MLTQLWKTRDFRRAQSLAERGDLEGAVRVYRTILDDRPDDCLARIHLALALANKGDYAEAAREARQAVKAADDRTAVRLFAGRVFYDAEDYPAARREFDAALEANPRNDLARGYRVMTRWAEGDSDAWRQLPPEQLPESTPFLARWLARIEMELRPKLRRHAEEGGAR